MKATIKEFLRLEAAGGILLIAAAVLAMLLANSPFFGYYDLLLGVPVEVRIGDLIIAKPLVLWINDGLMAVFFFLVGLELKREVPHYRETTGIVDKRWPHGRVLFSRRPRVKA